MKKTCLSMLFCLLFVMGHSALAETSSDPETDYKTYTNTTYGYHIDYPSEWMLLDKDTIDDYINQISNGEITIEGFASSALDTIKTMLSENEDISFVGFMDWSGNNFNVTCFDYPTPPSIEEANEVLSPQIIAAFREMFSNFTVLDSGSIYNAGGFEFIKVKCQTSINTQPQILTSFYYFKNGLVFNFAFAWMATETEEVLKLDNILETVMNSFVFES